MSTMEAFAIRQRANDGRRVALTLPDGSPTDHWLQIRSQWSDAFRQAREEAMQQVARMAQTGKSELDAALEQSLLAVRAALVSDWSFDEPCVPDNVRAFLREAPQIAELIDRAGADDQAFFGNAFASSPTG